MTRVRPGAVLFRARVASVSFPALFLAAALLASAAPRRCAASSALRVEGLRCEYLVDPLGIDAPRPRLCWTLASGRRAERQTAYRILVASSAEKLAADEGDLWDSGKVASDRTAHVEYGGKPLASRQACHWKVCAWDRDDQPSSWSPVAYWEMGLLDAGDWKGRWIGRTRETAYTPAPFLRKEFDVKGKVRRARIHVCGLGYHELSLNGARVGDHRLDPGYTRYDKRDLYVTHDVTSQLRAGRNAVGAILGTGWYNVHTQAVWYFDKAPWRAAPKLLLDLRIDYEDGSSETVASDGSWKTTTGPIVFDSIYGGETHDARLEMPGWDLPGFQDASWQPALVVDPPGGRLVAQAMPPIRISRTLRPAKVAEPKPGVLVFDMGQNFAGHARLKVSGPAGTAITLRYGERLHPDGSLDASNIAMHMVKTDPPQRFQTDVYILKGEGEEVWESRFVYHGFQYVEVTGAPAGFGLENIEGRVVHSSVPEVGRFECSNPLLGRIWENARWAYLSNLQGIPTDCPHREKNGWTGDAHLAAVQGLFNFDSAAVYAKWINDLDDEQRKEAEGKRHKGELPGIVPTSGWGYDWGNGPAWDSAFLLIPWYMHLLLGDTRVLADHYDGFKLYVDYLTSRAEGGIVSIGLGDWCPYQTETPVPVTSTAYYYMDARITAETAKLLGKKEDAEKYGALARSIRKAFNDKFLDREKGTYANGSQTALGCAIYFGLAEREDVPRVLDALVKNIEARGGHLDFGILGSKYVLRALSSLGRSDVAYGMVSKTTLPSWGHWIEQGATTLWESWGGADSRNHIMFGDVCAWSFEWIAGIRPDPSGLGFARITIAPEPVGDLTFARASYRSIRGLIRSEWQKERDRFVLEVEIPAGVIATVYLPAGERDLVMESGKPAAESEGVLSHAVEKGRMKLEVGSGTYRFAVSRPLILPGTGDGTAVPR